MLDELTVRSLALIERAHLEFSAGFNVLTGETGTGKTALVGAIKLLIGERADVSAISDDAEELMVSARLLDPDGRETVVSRRLSRQGRSRASINDELVSVTALSAEIGPHFDLLGQHEHQSLLSPAAQLSYLDNYGGPALADALSRYQAAWRQSQTAAAELSQLQAASQQSARSLEDARFILNNISAVQPVAGEYEQLQSELPILRRGEDLAIAAQAVWQLLREDQQVLDLLAQAARQLQSVQGIDERLDNIAERLDSALIDLEDLAAELLSYWDSVNFDATALDQALERLGQLEGLMRRFGPGMPAVLERWEAAQEQLALADNLPERLAAAEQLWQRSEGELATAAEQLAAQRCQAAGQLAECLTARLPELAFADAAIEAQLTALERANWTSNGSQRLELLYQPSARSLARPLAKIASGGELSRVMLALKIESVHDDGLTLVFDEVDAGIGGAAARAVGSYLQQLAATHQIIVITHLAQIAARADHHYVVEKAPDTEGRQITRIREANGEERVQEIARMLSGSTDAVALAHAQELLQGR
ncbi:MAG: DNA repair protein RecN [Actinomycetia bacterium]|nr:DNA repair protein RecN [Actinomycetes bacterium]